MNSADVLADAFGRVHDVVHEVVDGLTPGQLAHRVDEHSNTIAWLIWHLTRIQDDHVADAADDEQVWLSGGWAERFGLPFADDETGYGQSAEEVGQVRPSSAELLTGYFDAVHLKTVRYVSALSGEALDRIVDERWDPPVTLGVRLVSVISDDLQHAGQAAFIRGLVTR